MSFLWPWMLLTLLLIPLVVWGYVRLLKRRQRAVVALGPLGVTQNNAGANLQWRRHLPALFFLIGLTLLFFSLARPEMILELPRVEGTVILAFDVSNSMAATDLEPTRMEAAKAAARTFVENQPDTVQIGVVAFSNGGLVVQPPTDDQTAVLDTINRLTPQGATSLGQGIFTALNAIAGEAIALDIDLDALEEGSTLPDIGYYPSAVVLLLTDGENTSNPDPFEVAQLAAAAGVRIYPVGIGRPEGTVLSLEGFNVLTRLDETALQQIASTTNGAYYHAADAESLQEIYQNVDLQLAIRGDMMEVTAVFAGLSALFFLIGAALSLLWFGRMPL
ncbi:MAG: VWA domain-containing protein [Anaerolineae bacterium]|nr:VWA domain-containing protein [Anaerolineae bacterium]